MKVLDALAKMKQLATLAKFGNATEQARATIIYQLLSKTPKAHQERLQELLNMTPAEQQSNTQEILQILCAEQIKNDRFAETDQALINMHIAAGL